MIRRLYFQQFYFVANKSLLIILFCVCFAAMVTILESSFHMKLVIQNDSLVPGFAAMLILRELGAVVTALLLTARVGAGIAAEVGIMQITEQNDALKMLGIRPVSFLFWPRFWACVFAGVLLTWLADLVCLYAALLISQSTMGFTAGLFLSSLRRFVHFSDLIQSGVKGGIFGMVIPIVSCWFGFRCQSGAEGVGKATTQSVVISSVCIILLDFVLSFLFIHL
jgi:phospholipid/cholesterol/gamma-HCH transport system permease protein